MRMIDHLDHLVLTCTDPEATVDFYTRILGMRLEILGAGRQALRFGNQEDQPARARARVRACAPAGAGRAGLVLYR